MRAPVGSASTCSHVMIGSPTIGITAFTAMLAFLSWSEKKGTDEQIDSLFVRPPVQHLDFLRPLPDQQPHLLHRRVHVVAVLGVPERLHRVEELVEVLLDKLPHRVVTIRCRWWTEQRDHVTHRSPRGLPYWPRGRPR